jgi:hypothetical protein
MASPFPRDLFEQRRAVLEAYARKVLSSRKSDDGKRRIFTVFCKSSNVELAVVIETPSGAMVVTRRSRGQGIKAVEPLTADDAQEFPLARNKGVQFAPLTAGELWRRINRGDPKLALKRRADYDVMGYRVEHPDTVSAAKTRRDNLAESLREHRRDDGFFADSPVREELTAYLQRELTIAEHRLAEARGNTPDDREHR